MAKPKLVDHEAVQEIRFLYESGQCTQKQLADRFGLSQSTICKIVNNYIHKATNITMSGEAQVKVGYNHGN